MAPSIPDFKTLAPVIPVSTFVWTWLPVAPATRVADTGAVPLAREADTGAAPLAWNMVDELPRTELLVVGKGSVDAGSRSDEKTPINAICFSQILLCVIIKFNHLI